ncbi:MAG TPA: hypothetical protein DIC60_08700 [Lachnospiraceae bacterium]|nr:hypothetical protein [Lachnospiraceae bacterium]
MLDKQALLRNVNQPDERLLLAKVLDQADFSLKRHENTFTDFCDPGKMEIIIRAIGGIQGLNFTVFGGSDDCERRRIGFCPDYREIDEAEFPIKVVKISVNTKFSKELTHRDFLGSVLGLGIDRGKVGDIFLFEDYTLIFACEEIAKYICANLLRVGKTIVKTQLQAVNEAQMPTKKMEEKSVTVSSLRLDVLVGAAFNMSRGKAVALIESEKVFINWITAKSVSKVVKEGDMLSVRGFGRAKLLEVRGKTKKDRVGVVFLKYI